MPKRDRIFRFRLDEDEDRRFRQLAEERGVDRAELIREALGLDGAKVSSLPAAATPKKKADPKKEPGRAGIEELAARMAREKKK